MTILRNTLLNNPDSALNVAKNLCKTNPSINIHSIAELFMQANRPKEMTALLVDWYIYILYYILTYYTHKSYLYINNLIFQYEIKSS